MAVYYTNSKIDNVDFMEASDLEAIEAGFAAVNLDMIDLSGITDAPTALTNLGLTATAAEINLLGGLTSVATLGTNTFTGPQTISNTGPFLLLDETDATVDNGVWRIAAFNEGFFMQVMDDAQTAAGTFVGVGRTGNNIDTVDITADLFRVNGIEAATRGANTFTAAQTISSTSPLIFLDETDATVDNGVWRMTASGEGFFMQAMNDARTVAGTFLGVDRTGTNIDLVDITADLFRINGVEVATVNTNWATTDITSGTFADARIAATNVTQYVGSIDHDALLNFVANEHLDWSTDLGVINLHVNNLTAAAVTQHQASLSITESQISDLQAYALLASPALTGAPTAPTAAVGTSTTQLATTEFVWTSRLTALKTADESVTSSTVLQDDNHLFLSVEASSSYILEMLISFTGDSTGDMQMQFTGPTGFDYELFGTNTYDGSSPAAGVIFPFLMTEAGAKVIQVTNSTTHFIKLHGVVNTSTTAGTLTFQFAQLSSSATPLVVRQYSYLKLVKIT